MSDGFHYPVYIDLHGLESIDDAKTNVKGLTTELETLQKVAEVLPEGTHKNEVFSMIDTLGENINDLIRLRQNINMADNAQDQRLALNQYNYSKGYARKNLDMMAHEIGNYFNMLMSFSNEEVQMFSNGVKSIRPIMSEALNQTAKSLSVTGTKGKEQIIQTFKKTNAFKDLWGSLQAQNPKVFSDEIADKFLKSSFLTMVSKQFVNEFTEWNKQEGSMPSHFKQRIPSKFRQLPLTRNPELSKLDSNSPLLTNNERDLIEHWIKEHPYLADEAETAGLIKRYNGRVYSNPKATQGHVGAFGGNLLRLFEAAERGGPFNGIVDLENQQFSDKQLTSLLNKTNSGVDNSLHGMRFLQDNFPWLTPTYTEQQKTKLSQKWRNLGSYHSPGRQRSMNLFQISPEDVDRKGNVKIKTQPDTRIADQKQGQPMVYNQVFDAIENLPAETKKALGIKGFEHNGFSRDMILMRVPIEQLENPEITDEEKANIHKDMTRAMSKMKLNGEQYVPAGYTGTHAVMMRKSVHDAIEQNYPGFFSYGGAMPKEGLDYGSFLKYMDYSRKIYTDVEPVSKLYGTDLSDAEVVVADMKAITGLDGQNIGSKKFFPETFLSRGHRNKGTTQSVSLEDVFANPESPYYKFYNPETDMVNLPRGGINGGPLSFNLGKTALIEDLENLKTRGAYPEGITQEELNKDRTDVLRKRGWFAKTSVSGFHTNARFISSQEASTLQLNEEARDYFTSVAMKRVSDLQDNAKAIKMLFSGEDTLSQLIRQDPSKISEPLAQERIEEEISSIFKNIGEGRYMLPEDVGSYAMMSAWIPNVLNSLIGEENLTPEQKAVALTENEAAYLKDFSAKLWAFRNPATVGGNVTAENKANQESIEWMANLLGLNEEDRKQFFLNPAGRMLEIMQGADLDSDTAHITPLMSGLAKIKGSSFGQIMRAVLEMTDKYNEELKTNGGYSEQELNELAKTQVVKDKGSKKRYFAGESPEAIADMNNWFLNTFGKAGRMGYSNAVSLYAHQYPLSPIMKRASQASEKDYDYMSVYNVKKDERWIPTEDEKQIIGNGAPFFKMYKWAKDAEKTSDEEYEEGGIKPGTKYFDYDAFFKRGIDKANFPSIHDSHGMEADLTAWMMTRRHPGLMKKLGYDWEDIFAHAPEVDENTRVGQFVKEMRTWKAKKANQDFLVFDDDLIDRWMVMADNAKNEIRANAEKKGLKGKALVNEIDKRFSEIGGNVPEFVKKYGATRSNIANSEYAPDIVKAAMLYGENRIFGGTGAIIPERDAPEVYSSVDDIQNVMTDASHKVAERVRQIRKNNEKNKASETQALTEEQHYANAKSSNNPLEYIRKTFDLDEETAQRRLDLWEKQYQKSIDKRDELANSESKAIENTNVEIQSTLPAQTKTITPPAYTSSIVRPKQTGNFLGTKVNQQQSNIVVDGKPLTLEELADPEIAGYLRSQNELEKQLEMRVAYEASLSEVREHNRKLYSSLGKQEREIKGQSEASEYIGRQKGEAKNIRRGIQESFFKQYGDELGNVKGLSPEDREILREEMDQMNENVHRAILNQSRLSSKRLTEGLNKDLDNVFGAPDKRRTRLNEHAESLKQIGEWQNELLNERKGASPTHQKEIDETLDWLASEKKQQTESYGRLRNIYKDQVGLENNYDLEKLQQDLGLVDKFSPEVISAARLQQIQDARNRVTQRYKDKFISPTELESANKLLDSLEKEFSVEALTDKQKTRQEDLLASLDQRNQELEFRSREAQIQRNRQYEQQRRQAWGGSHSRFANSFLRQEDIKENLAAQKRAADNGIRDTALTISRLNKKRDKTKEGSEEYIAKTGEIENATKKLEDYKKASSDAEQQMQSFGTGTNLMRAGLASVSDTMGMLLKRFGRQMFMKAINEAKQFVKQYDKTMAEIQMITLKSDSEMGQVSDSIIGKAKELKVSISEVSQSAATLYRQGLTDQEVEDRLGVISKFSKVSGTKVADATKLITVAMNTGLVTDAMEASDIVTALGDNAATNAQQIEKGIEKAGAAAAADGTTFGQLAAMLTAITSTTQIGGNVAGRTLNTIFGRMNKIGTNELIIDENGNQISGSAVAKLLAKQGINMYDERGNKRSSFDTLYALSQKWEGMTDAEQQQMANAIAGTRQYSNFSAIMQGMSEGKIDEYMDLIGESSGITNKKFETYSKSLEASLMSFKNTFDSIINDLADKGMIENILSGLSDMVTGIGEVVKAGGGLSGLLLPLSTIAIVMAGIRGGAPGAIAMGAIVAGLGIAGAIGHTQNSKVSASDQYQQYLSTISDNYNTSMSSIDRFKSLAYKENRTEAENNELLYLARSFGNISDSASSVEALTSAIGGLGDAAGSTVSSIEELADNIAQEAEKDAEKRKVKSFFASLDANKGAGAILEGIQSGMKEYESNDGIFQLTSAYNQFIEDNPDFADKFESGSEFSPQHLINSIIHANNLAASPTAIGYKNKLAKIFSGISSVSFSEDLKYLSEEDWNKIFSDVTYLYRQLNDVPYKDQGKKRTNLKQNPEFKEYFESEELFNLLLDNLPGLIESETGYRGTAKNKQEELLEENITSVLEENENLPFDKSLIPYIAKGFAKTIIPSLQTNANNEYILPTPEELSEIIKTELGYSDNGTDNETVTSQAERMAVLGGYVKPISTQLKEAGLPEVSRSGYYIDSTKQRGEKGYIVSSEKALQMSAEEQKNLLPVNRSALYGADYSVWQSDKKNSYAVTADNVLRAIAQSGKTNIQDIIDYVESDKNLSPLWDSLYEDVEFKALMDQIYRNPSTGEMIAPAGFEDQLYNYLYSKGTDYGKRQISQNKKGTAISEAINGIRNEGWFVSQTDFEKDVTNEYNARLEKYREGLRAKNYDEDTISEWSANWQKKFTLEDYRAQRLASGRFINSDVSSYMTEVLGNELASKIKDGSATNEDYALASTLATNYTNGIVGLTEQDKLNELKRIQSMSKEELTKYWTESQYTAKQYGAGYSDFDKYMALATAKILSPEEEKQLEAYRIGLNNYIRESDVGTVTKRIKQLESAGQIQQGVSSLYEQLVSPVGETRRSAGRSIASEYSQILQAQAAMAELQALSPSAWGTSSGQYLATVGTFLGLTQEEQNKYKTYNAEEQSKLYDEITQKAEDFTNKLKDLAQLFTSEDLSEISDISGLMEALGASGEEGAAGLRAVIEALVGLSAQTTVEDIFANNEYTTARLDRITLSSLATSLQPGKTINDLVGHEMTFETADQLNDFLNRNTQVKDIFNRVADNGGTFTQADINALTELTPYGMDNVDTGFMNNYDKLMSFKTKNGGFNVDKIRKEMDNDQEFKSFMENIGDVNAMLDDAQGTVDGTGEEFHKFSNQLREGANNALKPYGSETKNIISQGTKFRGTIKDQNEAMKSFRSTLKTISNNQFLRNAFRQGKNVHGLSEYIESLGFDKKDRSNAKMKEKILDAMNLDEAADESMFLDSIKSIFGLMQDSFNEYVNENPIEIDGMQVNVGSGSVHVSTEELLANFGEALDETQQACVQEALAKGTTIDWIVSWFGKKTIIKPVEAGLGEGSSGGGGGGGGGKKKSATEKLLEKQARKIAKLQHKQNMNQIAESKYDYLNDYDAQNQNYNDQIETEEKLKKQHEANIKKLKKQLKKTTDPEERKKLQEQIEKEEEEAAKNETNIFEIKKKQHLTMVDERQTNRQKPLEHQRSMLDIYAQRGEITGRYEDYAKNTRDAMVANREKQAMNEADIAEWKNQLSQVEQGSDLWIEIRDKIYQKEQENAQLENDWLQMQNDLIEKRLEDVAKQLQHATQLAQHNLNIADIWGGYYESAGYRDLYENTLVEKRVSDYALIEQNRKAREEALKTAAEAFANGQTDQYHDAIAAVYEYDEAIQQLTVDIYGIDQALAESKLQSIVENYEDATNGISNLNDRLKNFAENALSIGDYKSYTTAVKMQLEDLEGEGGKLAEALERVKAAEENLHGKNGVIARGLDDNAVREATQGLEDAKNEYAAIELEIEQLKRNLQKAQVDELLNNQQLAQSDYDHNQKLLSYQISSYKNNGEYTNYGKALQKDTEMRIKNVARLKDEEEALKNMLEQVKNTNDPESEKRLTEEIKKREEARASENAQVEQNTKLIEENKKKIRQAQKTIEDALDKQIEAQKKRDKEILAANVSMQENIVNILKKRLQDEWALKKKDIEKEKEALAEYKKLINDRFNYRKKASQQANKDEELAEYKRQLALLQADPTRSKDAKELQRKIDDLEKERGWTIAEDEVAAENERVDNQTEALNKFVSYNEELLNEILGDANNFVAEINALTEGSFEDSYKRILEFMQSENDAFMKSLPDAQRQMIQSWEDTWKKAKDIIDTNYPEIVKTLDIYNEDGTLRTYEELSTGDYRQNYIESQKKSLEYRKAQEENNLNTMRLLEITYNQQFDDFLNSIKDDFTFTEDNHDLSDIKTAVDKLTELGDPNKIFKVEDIDANQAEAAKKREDIEAAIKAEEEKLAAEIQTIESSTPTQTTATTTTTSTSTAAPPKQKRITNIHYEFWNNYYHYKYVNYDDGTSERKQEQHTYINGKCICGYNQPKKSNASSGGGTGNGSGSSPTTGSGQTTSPGGGTNYNYTRDVHKYASGGLADYTGYAWVDGTKTHPEAFLSATDTENIRALLDAFNYVKVLPYMSNYDPSAYGNTTNIGDVNITINQAELKSDADVAKLAKQVGQAFSKELQKNGLNLSGYSFT